MVVYSFYLCDVAAAAHDFTVYKEKSYVTVKFCWYECLSIEVGDRLQWYAQSLK